MSTVSSVSLGNGYVSSRDPYDFSGGELRRMLGTYYKPGDNRVWKQLGRNTFGTVLVDNRVKGLALCQFDSGTDKLVAYSGTALYGATPGVTGTFSALVTGLSASGSQLTACHQDDRWYLGNGVDRNKCLKSDGTIRDAGLNAPSTAPVVTKQNTSGSTANPVSNSGSFTNPTFAYDGNDGTYASATRTTAGATTHTWTFAADTASSKKLEILWWLSGLPIPSDTLDRTGGTGTRVDSGYNVTVKIEKSEDNGSNWTTLLIQTYDGPPAGIQTISSTLGSGAITVLVRGTITYNNGVNPATLQFYTIKTKTGSAATAQTTTDGIYYAVTWYNASDGFEGPPRVSDKVTLAGENQTTITRPASPEAAATHWNIYRVVDGLPPTIINLNFLTQKLIAETTHIDDFSIAITEVTGAVVPLVTLGDLSFPRDSPPPAAAFMFVHDASIIILRDDAPRACAYSEVGFPESYPEFYVVSAFSLDEHDRLLCGTSLGRSAALFAEGAVLAVDGLPRVVDGQFDAGQARPLKGHPGCVGRMAMAPFSVSGEARAAWVSPFGVYQTNGETCEPLSLDLDWSAEVNTSYLSTALLKWNPDLLVLEFHFDTDGDGANDRVALIHMSPTHQKQSGQPKWSQPTEKHTACLAGGLIDGTYRRYSGHTSDGVVYLEGQGYVDASTGDAISMDVETGDIGEGRVDQHCVAVNLLHSDWGDGETGTLTVTAKTNASSQVVNKTVRLDGQRGREVMVARAGEKFSYRFRHSTDAGGGLLGLEPELERQGRSLSAGRWQTVSAE